CASNYGGYW
nr:immunoglobulin heavy chain junction region [Mus musculus]NSM09269.1 immunoglobulin heavy chain junction region [Mus musculus]